MRNTAVLDANVILRYLLDDHPEHSPVARELLGQVRTGDRLAYVPEGVLVECVFVLLKVYAVPRPEVADKLRGVLSFRGVLADNRDLLLESLRLFDEKNVDIVDAIVHVTAQRRGWEAVSFDKDLTKLT